MRIYLVQHGEAVAKEIDPDRPLSSRGKNDVRRVAAVLKQNGAPVGRVLHSGKTRARQTAEILAYTLHDNGHVEAITGIAPNDPVAEFARTMPAMDDNTMFVGHLPFMAKLVGLLLGGNENLKLVAYQPGSVACLEGDESAGWQIQWLIRPDCITDTSSIT